jgi:O-antigen ligase
VSRPDASSTNRAGFALIRCGAAFMGVALIASLWASPDRTASLPWVALALLGVSLVLLVTGPCLATVTQRLRPGHLLWFFLGIGFVTLSVTLLASRWPTYKLSWLNSVYAALPSIRSLPWWWAQGGLHPNQTGGMLALCAAFAAAVATAGSLKARYRWPAIFLAMAGIIGVFITGSRAALAGLAVAVLLVLVVRTSRWVWAWGAGLAIVALGLLASGQIGRIVHFFLRDENLDTKLGARLDIWSSALSGIHDHFFTGIGLGVFNQVMPSRYPYQTVGLSYPVSQAHNLLLDTALGTGAVGALGLALLLGGALLLVIGGKGEPHLSRVVSLGILVSMVAYITFGITDSIGLSTPTSFIMWLWVCALATLHSPTLSREDGVSCQPQLDSPRAMLGCIGVCIRK